MTKKNLFTMTFLCLSFCVFGQAITYSLARPVNCSSSPDGLHPVPGIPYVYKADIVPEKGQATWFVTTNPVFIENGILTNDLEFSGGDYVESATGIGLSTVDQNPSEIEIVWNPVGLSRVDYSSENKNPLFVGVFYDGPEEACGKNIQAFKVSPIIAFTLDITNVKMVGNEYIPVAYNETLLHCPADPLGSEYDFGTDRIMMNYGTNILMYEVIAANFTDSFHPYFSLEGLATGQTADLYWGYSPETANIAIATGITGNWTMAIDEALSATTNIANTSNGVSIFVRVDVHQNKYEGLVGNSITLMVDGYGNGNIDDVNDTCAVEGSFADQATQDLLRRPSISNEDPSSFLIKN